MAAVTLHKLLWGVAESGKIGDWKIRAFEIPAIGLPTRVAVALFLAARAEPVPENWDIRDGPLVWCLNDCKKLLSAGRRLQLGYSEHTGNEMWPERSPVVHRSTEWDVPPHPAYYMPLVDRSEVHPESYVLYCDVLLLLTALDGGERILDSLYRTGLAGTPFTDRWAWRSRIHLEEKTWEAVDDAVRWATTPTVETTAKDSLVNSIDVSSKQFGFEDFVAERVDLLLQEGKYLEVVRSVGSFQESPTLPPQLELGDDGLLCDLAVRIAQISKWYSEVPNSFPNVATHEAQSVMQQVAASFHSSASDVKPALVLLPEVSIPQSEVWTLRELVKKSGVAALAGLFWKELPAAYPRYQKAKRWIVNEAELIIPLGHDTAGPPTVRWFRIRKPVPTHIEAGLASVLTRQSQIESHLLRGRRWYRFVHQHWGDFSIAICADLIDAEAWRIFRGEMMHLFTVAFNKDVELYDALTWVRAYESYVNVLAVNHGYYGGSFAWTPKGSHARELARLRGSDLFLLADVKIPVKSLRAAQIHGVKQAADAAEEVWLGGEQMPQTFKAPPPGYRRRPGHKP